MVTPMHPQRASRRSEMDAPRTHEVHLDFWTQDCQAKVAGTATSIEGLALACSVRHVTRANAAWRSGSSA